MSARTGLTFNIASGRDDEARGILRDYAAYLEGFGGRVSVYRALYAGEQTGRVIVLFEAADIGTLASILDRVIGDGANNPYVKSVGSAAPPFTDAMRSLWRSIEPDAPLLPQLPVRSVLSFTATPETRAELEAALREARVRHAALGGHGDGSVSVATGAATTYGYVIMHDSLAEMVEFEATNAPSAAGAPLSALIANGAVTMTGRRIDTRYNVAG